MRVRAHVRVTVYACARESDRSVIFFVDIAIKSGASDDQAMP